MVAIRPYPEPLARAEGSLETTEVHCAHCNNLVPPGLVQAGAERQFCCGGCQTVFEVLSGKGLTEYYARRAESVGAAKPVKTTHRTYLDFDDPGFLDKHARARGDGCQSIDLYLEGVHCAACMWLVEKVLKEDQGVVDARLDLGRSTLSIAWDQGATKLSGLGKQLERLGYLPHVATLTERQIARRREDRQLLIRIAVAGASFGNAMLMAFALYGGLFEGIEAEWSTMFRWASLAVALPSIFYSATPFFRGALNSIRAKVPNMDLPIAVGLSLGTLAGAINIFRGSGEIYFDSLTALVFLLLSGRWLQAFQHRRATDAAEMLYALAPATARIVTGAGSQEVPTENVGVGSLVEVRPSETIPVDGVLERGATSLDLSVLTGESRPIEAKEGDAVAAGALNLSANITVRAGASGSASRLSRLMKLVEEGAEHRAPVVLEADRMAGKFVARVLILAALTLLAWLYFNPAEAVDHTIALLVVSCPCALALATPLAVSAAIGQAARVGIFIKGGDTLERLARPSPVWFDKTGTLTEGKQVVVEQAGTPEALSAAGRLAKATTHPVSLAVAKAFAADGATAPEDTQQTLGGGVVGSVEGVRFALGSPRYVRSLLPNSADPSRYDALLSAWAARGLTPVLLADLSAGALVAAVAVADRPRDDAKPSVETLRALGYLPGVLSGDDPVVVRQIAQGLGIEADRARGGVTPEGKLEAVSESAVIMVGDGANDAAALSRAGVGIAVHGGTEASLGAAHVFLRRPGVGPVVEAIEGSRRTLAVIRRNMIASLIYNLLGVSLAAFGLIGPLGAAILMPLSSLTVVLLSYRSRTFLRR
ncbi:MAG: heavy metal translocating P-type ATPase [Myxococcota bacterium]